MNMKQSMLDTMTSSGGANRTDADSAMKELASYVFPITEDDNPTSSTIQKRVAAKDEYGNPATPVDFAWAAAKFGDMQAVDEKQKFLVDLATSIVGERKDTSMFFPSHSQKETESYGNRWHLVSKMKGGPEVFELFRTVAAPGLTKLGLSSYSRNADDHGESYTVREDNSAFEDVYGQYYSKLENKLDAGCKFLKGKSDDEDVLLYGAYLNYIFTVFNNALTRIMDSNGEEINLVSEYKNDREAALKALMSESAKNIEYYITGNMSRNSIGSLKNSGSVYNEGTDRMRVVSAEEIEESDISEYYAYPQYVIELLKLNPQTLSKFIDVLKTVGNGKYQNIVQELSTLTTSAKSPDGSKNPSDSKILDITPADLIAMLKDKAVIDECMRQQIGDIFNKKGGSDWVGKPGALDKLIKTGTVQQGNADLRDTRIVGIATGRSYREAKTRRENTGDGIIKETHKGLLIAKATAVDEQGKPSDERSQNPNYANDIDYSKEIEKSNKYAENRGTVRTIKFTTPDSENTHEFVVNGTIDERLAKFDLNKVVSLKNAGTGTHEYFIGIPRGLVFAAMIGEDGNLVRNENQGTLCAGLKLDGKPFTKNSPGDVLDLPISKYCTAVAKYGKTGRIRFASEESNAFYTDMLNTLKNMKANSQSFNKVIPTGDSKDEKLSVIRALIEIKEPDTVDKQKLVDSVKAMLNDGMDVETYDENAKKFVFVPIPAGHTYVRSKTLLSHLVGMYNLDSVNGFVDSEDVQSILEAVVPNKWDISQWNYGNVLKAERAWHEQYGTHEEEEVHYPDNMGEDAGEADVYNLIDNTGYDDNDFSNKDDGVSSENAIDALVGDIGSNYGELARQIYDNVFTELFADKEKARLEGNNVVYTAKDAQSLKENLIERYRAVKDDFPVDISRVIENIPCDNFNKFRKMYNNAVYTALRDAPADTDTSLRVGMLLNNGNSISTTVSNTLSLLNRKVEGDESLTPDDKALIPAMGSLMVKTALEKAGDNNELSAHFDSEYLTSVFDKAFKEKYTEASNDVKEAKKAATSGIPMTRLQQHRFNKAARNWAIYDKIQKKIAADSNYVNKVAEMVSSIGNDIHGLRRTNKPTSTETFIPFIKDTTSTTEKRAGWPLVEFCTYNVEGKDESQLARMLDPAFANASIYNMMDRLLGSVPQNCLTLDYDVDKYGYTPVDVKSMEVLKQNENQAIASYLNTAKNNKGSCRYAIDKVNNIYAHQSNNDAVKMFASENGSGNKSPYAYNNVDINLGEVKRFFDELMQLAESYNYLGGTSSNQKQKLVQQTANNIRQGEKNLVNQYFVGLKQKFDAIVNNAASGAISEQDRDVLDTVMREVVVNPMNVLINNNAKLITAFKYYKDIAQAGRRSAFQSGADYGLGNGATKSTAKENEIVGRSPVINKLLPTLRYAVHVCQSKGFVDYVNNITSVGIKTAEEDYSAYCKDIAETGQSPIRILNKAKTIAADSNPEAGDAYLNSVKQTEKLFVNYGVPEDSSPLIRKQIAGRRVKELVVLLYETCRKIANTFEGSKYGSLEAFIDAVAANDVLMHIDISELLDLTLLDRLANLDAELELADVQTYKKVMNLASGRSQDATEPFSNNNPMMRSVSHFRGNSRYADENTAGLIDKIISDEPLDTNALANILADMDKEGDPAHGSAITFNGGTFDVVETGDYNGTAAMSIVVHRGDRRTALNLKTNDILVVRDSSGYKNYARVLADDITLSQFTKGEYIIDNIGLSAGKTNVPFSRYQPGNKLLAPAMAEKAMEVVDKMNDWYKQYQPHDARPQAMPDDIRDKVLMLCLLYSKSSCAAEVKSLVIYSAWRVSNFSNNFKPSALLDNGLSFAGAEISTNRYAKRLISEIIEDFKRFERGGTQQDQDMYVRIVDELPKGITEYIRDVEGYDTMPPERVQETAEETAKTRESTGYVMDTLQTLTMLVNFIAQKKMKLINSGVVTIDDVKDVLRDKDVRKAFGIDSDPESLIKALDNEYKEDIDQILAKNNASYESGNT